MNRVFVVGDVEASKKNQWEVMTNDVDHVQQLLKENADWVYKEVEPKNLKTRRRKKSGA